MSEEVYTVWVGGTEVNDYLLTLEEAQELAQEYTDDDYDEVAIDKYTQAEIDRYNPKSA